MNDQLSKADADFMINLTFEVNEFYKAKIAEYEKDNVRRMALQMSALVYFSTSCISAFSIITGKPHLQTFALFMQQIEDDLNKADKSGLFKKNWKDI